MRASASRVLPRSLAAAARRSDSIRAASSASALSRASACSNWCSSVCRRMRWASRLADRGARPRPKSTSACAPASCAGSLCTATAVLMASASALPWLLRSAAGSAASSASMRARQAGSVLGFARSAANAVRALSASRGVAATGVRLTCCSATPTSALRNCRRNESGKAARACSTSVRAVVSCPAATASAMAASSRTSSAEWRSRLLPGSMRRTWSSVASALSGWVRNNSPASSWRLSVVSSALRRWFFSRSMAWRRASSAGEYSRSRSRKANTCNAPR